jgi:hypothetical protein
MQRTFSLDGTSAIAAAFLCYWSSSVCLATSGDMSPEDLKRCEAAAAVCAAGDDPVFCMTYKKNFTSEGLDCPGVNSPALPVTITRPMAPTSSGGAFATTSSGNKIQEIHALCTARADTPLSSEIPCEKALINASEDPIFNSRDPATQLYMIEADKLLRRLEDKRMTEIDARATLLRKFLDLEDRHRPELMAIAARESAAAVTAQQQSAQLAASQERENQRVAAEESAREAEARKAQQQQNQAVAFCVAEAKERIAGANRTVKNQIAIAEGGYLMRLGLNRQSGPPFIEATCLNNQYWYKSIPQPSKTLDCQSNGYGNATCREQ